MVIPMQATKIVTIEDLRELGLDEKQITRLEKLRADYPFSEFAASALEWRRLCFLKWRLEREKLPR